MNDNERDTDTGDGVMDWLGTDTAARQARRLAARRGLTGQDAMSGSIEGADEW